MENQTLPRSPTNHGCQLIMGEYALHTIGNQPSPINFVEISRQYELKSMHINHLLSFYMLPTEDCLQFMKEYSAVLETFLILRLMKEKLHIQCFQYCLKEKAKQWLMVMRSGSFTTWGQVCATFFNSFLKKKKS